MDLVFFLILDAVALFVATMVITYFFFKDLLKGKKKKN
jgi:hypothetical protein